MGPTCTGKTSIAIELAKKINAEIINVDSTIIYKYLNIGSAKPSNEQMKAIPHHLINIMHPTLRYSVKHFLQDVHKSIIEIKSRKKNILFVGGSMMYFKALKEGISNFPEYNEQVRHQLKKKTLLYY